MVIRNKLKQLIDVMPEGVVVTASVFDGSHNCRAKLNCSDTIRIVTACCKLLADRQRHCIEEQGPIIYFAQ